MTCDKCGAPTTRSGMCKGCARDECREESLQGGQSTSGPLLVYKCVECGHRYRREGLEACPECGAGRAVCKGKVEEVSA